MRKNQRLLIAGILLLASTAVAQGQAVYEAFGNAVMAREGGAGEKAGAIVLFSRTGGDAQRGNRYSEVFRPARGGDNGNGDLTGIRSD